MATGEVVSEGVLDQPQPQEHGRQPYRLPPIFRIRYRFSDDFRSHQELYDRGYRLRNIGRLLMSFEPYQEGVHRYPPIRTKLRKGKLSAEQYVSMEPTDWEKLGWKVHRGVVDSENHEN